VGLEFLWSWALVESPTPSAPAVGTVQLGTDAGEAGRQEGGLACTVQQLGEEWMLMAFELSSNPLGRERVYSSKQW
jgi:hypothetical protein